MHISYTATSRINANPRNIVVLGQLCSDRSHRPKGGEKTQKKSTLGILGLFAVVFMWRAIWDWSEMYFSSTGSFIVGLILVGVVAFLQRDHVKELF
ncbi:MAG TPA: hypothetical protein VKA40_10955 [Nitrososphaera sp.]|nr:hypothetical protein [Nitrososphaeraceae archaeon]HKH87057.1 hypothetical protein [Nitrososphaera sp.]